MTVQNVLLIDDDVFILRSLYRVLSSFNIDLYTASTAAEARHLSDSHQFSLIVSDQRMPDINGTELLQELSSQQPHSTRILLSAYSDFNDVTNAFNNRIIDKFLPKPWDNHTLRETIKAALSLDNQSTAQSHTLSMPDTFHGLFSQCPQMHELFELIKRVATANVPINIYGETGTGKELVARALHQEGLRKEQTFIAINCANLSPELAESQLFGHKKGAFTGADKDSDGLLAAANGGTLFLDEVTCLPDVVQSKLLRALQEREYYRVGTTHTVPFDVQLISASSQSLEDAVNNNQFRADLRYRLEVIPVTLPPLRQRDDDAILLFELFANQDNPNAPVQLSPELKTKIANYSWPGNIRELYNAATYARVVCDSAQMSVEHLPRNVLALEARENTPDVLPGVTSVNPTSSTLDRDTLLQVLEQHRHNKTRAAESLGISRMTLWRYMKQYDL